MRIKVWYRERHRLFQLSSHSIRACNGSLAEPGATLRCRITSRANTLDDGDDSVPDPRMSSSKSCFVKESKSVLNKFDPMMIPRRVRAVLYAWYHICQVRGCVRKKCCRSTLLAPALRIRVTSRRMHVSPFLLVVARSLV